MSKDKRHYIFINFRTLVRYHEEWMTDPELDNRNSWVRRNIGNHMGYVTPEYYDELLNPPKKDCDTGYEEPS